MVPETGTLRLGTHLKGDVIGARLGTLELHVFASAIHRPRRCMFCGQAMSSHRLFEYRPAQEAPR